MKKRLGIGCLLLLVSMAILWSFAWTRADRAAESVARRAMASLQSPELIDQIPAEWIDILLKVEDPSFFDHRGVDFRTPGQGWTTLTQGIVKRYFPGPLRGAWGKTRQSVFALALDRRLGKKEQLQVFFEAAYFGTRDGRDLLGFENASRALFDKPLLDLPRRDYIRLVAMFVGPNHFDPVERPADNLERAARIEELVAGRCEPVSWRDVYLTGCEARDR